MQANATSGLTSLGVRQSKDLTLFCGALFDARFTATAVWFDVRIKVFFAVIDGDFFISLDRFERIDVDAIFLNPHFRIWLARVIDIARDIQSCAAEHHIPIL